MYSAGADHARGCNGATGRRKAGTKPGQDAAKDIAGDIFGSKPVKNCVNMWLCSMISAYVTYIKYVD